VKIAIGNTMMAPANDWAERCRLAKEAGFDGVEMWIGSDDFTMESTDDDVKRMADGIRDAGLEVSSIASTLGWKYPISSPDDAIFEQALWIGRRQIECATLFGTDAILVVTGGAERSVYQLDGLRRAIEGFRQLAAYAADRGVKIGAETCPKLSKNLMTPYECVGFVKDVGSDAVGIYLDTANVMYSGFPEHFVRALGSDVVRIHFKDLAEVDGNVRSTYPGNGTVEFGPVVEECKRVGYDSWAIMEYSPFPGESHSFELMQKAASGTRAVLGA